MFYFVEFVRSSIEGNPGLKLCEEEALKSFAPLSAVSRQIIECGCIYCWEYCKTGNRLCMTINPICEYHTFTNRMEDPM